ncbi:D-glycero-beta-D-manno-heptose 1,7-bisphosphate 7-phosphatase [Bacterioplanoides sp.]|uniref:D-glycero-beta-D-manno-heptose 1,7-bisphosphate 7-phosphatase n=1 Tax=Bacterioplanoides sp. TaxID=2066072 RepID=UPI003B5A66BF
MNKLIILDRDGVINQDSDAYVKSVDEWIPIPGSAKAIADLCKAGFQVAVATNQSGLARQYFTQSDLDAMHKKMAVLVKAEGGKFAHIAWCPHGPDDDCNCRKPLPGLIHQIEKALNVSAEGAWMVGDSLRDLQAGAAANCKVALVKTGKGEKTLPKLLANEELKNSKVFCDLAEFVDFILASE